MTAYRDHCLVMILASIHRENRFKKFKSSHFQSIYEFRGANICELAKKALFYRVQFK
jgi:hypothetical protein